MDLPDKIKLLTDKSLESFLRIIRMGIDIYMLSIF